MRVSELTPPIQSPIPACPAVPPSVRTPPLAVIFPPTVAPSAVPFAPFVPERANDSWNGSTVNPLVVRVEFDTSVVAVVVRAVEVTTLSGNGSVVVTVPDCAVTAAEAVVAQKTIRARLTSRPKTARIPRTRNLALTAAPAVACGVSRNRDDIIHARRSRPSSARRERFRHEK